jgi:hypothetical protein
MELEHELDIGGENKIAKEDDVRAGKWSCFLWQENDEQENDVRAGK